MGTILFMMTAACLGLVLYWYLLNVEKAGHGGCGLLAVNINEGTQHSDMAANTPRYVSRAAPIERRHEELGKIAPTRRAYQTRQKKRYQPAQPEKPVRPVAPAFDRFH